MRTVIAHWTRDSFKQEKELDYQKLTDKLSLFVSSDIKDVRNSEEIILFQEFFFVVLEVIPTHKRFLFRYENFQEIEKELNGFFLNWGSSERVFSEFPSVNVTKFASWDKQHTRHFKRLVYHHTKSERLSYVATHVDLYLHRYREIAAPPEVLMVCALEHEQIYFRVWQKSDFDFTGFEDLPE